MSSQETMPSSAPLYADAVLEGGALLGIAHVGALSVAEAKGYQWQHCAGTSAGAIVAALVAAGYTAAELTEMLRAVSFAGFAQDKGLRGSLPFQMARLVSRGGLHTGNELETFLHEKLEAKGKRKFGDLIMPGQENTPKTSRFRYKLITISSDITNQRMLRLPQDLAYYGLDPDELDIARAVRMSASIPFFFRPILQFYNDGKFFRAVDGGLLSNFPVGIFDVSGIPDYPTFGLRLVDTPPQPVNAPPTRTGESLYHFGLDLLNTMLNAHDRLYLDDHAYVRTIAIQIHGINGMQFNLKKEQIDALFQRGRDAATLFFETWDFEAYKAAYRAGSLPPDAGGSTGPARQERLHLAMREQASTLQPTVAARQSGIDEQGNLT